MLLLTPPPPPLLPLPLPLPLPPCIKLHGDFLFYFFPCRPSVCPGYQASPKGRPSTYCTPTLSLPSWWVRRDCTFTCSASAKNSSTGAGARARSKRLEARRHNVAEGKIVVFILPSTATLPVAIFFFCVLYRICVSAKSWWCAFFFCFFCRGRSSSVAPPSW